LVRGGFTTTVVLPHDLLEAGEDGFHVLFHERGTQNTWDRKVVGNEEAVKDLNTSDIDVDVYRILYNKSIIVCIFDAGHTVELFSVTAPIGREQV